MTQLKKMGMAVALLMTMASFAAAQCANRCCALCGKKVCHLEVSTETESVSGFEVKPKDICIPGIKLPWECKRRCGGVRTICVLEGAKKDKTICKYDWSVKTICTTCCSKHGLRRGAKSCDVCSDERVPFDYYAAAPLADTSVQAEGVQQVPAKMAGATAASATSMIATPASPKLGSEEAAQATAKVSTLTRLRLATKSLFGFAPAK
ncbi:MAG: hypothetical protein Aurels2KO_24950 [Aureliella sp.]